MYTSSKYFDKKCENETDLINNLKNLEIVPKIEVVAKNEDVHQDTPKSMPSVKKLIERFTNKNTENRGSSLRRSSTFSSEINLSQRNGLGVRPRNYSSTFEVPFDICSWNERYSINISDSNSEPDTEIQIRGKSNTKCVNISTLFEISPNIPLLFH